GRHDHREGGMGGADLLEQSHAIGVREAEVEHQDFGAECFELPAGLAPARGEGNLVPIGEESVIGPPQRHLILDEQYFAPPRGRPGLFRLAAWTSSSLPPLSAPVIGANTAMRLRCHPRADRAKLRLLNRLSKSSWAPPRRAVPQTEWRGAYCKAATPP